MVMVIAVDEESTTEKVKAEMEAGISLQGGSLSPLRTTVATTKTDNIDHRSRFYVAHKVMMVMLV